MLGMSRRGTVRPAVTAQARLCRESLPVEIRELHALRGETIRGGRLQDGVAGESKIAIALVIGEDDDDIGLAAGGGARQRAGAHCGGGQRRGCKKGPSLHMPTRSDT
jgi:hypothetical protein